MRLHTIDRIGLYLLAATGVTVALGEAGLGAGADWPGVVMLALVFMKAWWIALDFMELRHAPALWRRLLLGWLVAVLLLIVLGFSLTARPATPPPDPAGTVAPLS